MKRVLTILAAVLWLAAPSMPAATAAPAAVSVYPLPGSGYNRPQTQITFRGIPAAQLGQIQVVGSKSGDHSGRIDADSDGDGGSFLPAQPFDAGESVTVSTGLNIVGGSGGTFTFKVGNVAPLLAYGKLPLVKGGSSTLQHFRSQPGFEPPVISVKENHAPASAGDIFIAPQFGPAQNGPMILSSRGQLLWFDPFPVAKNLLITDFRTQELGNQPVLTWWQGNTNNGHGRGVDEIYNSHYQPIATVHAGNGLDAGLHEFYLTNNGDAYITASSPVHLPGVNKPTVDSVVQEIDVATGLVLFQWNALDHIPLKDSYMTPSTPGHTFDPFHVNSVDPLPNGDLLISMRHTSAVYEIDRSTGKVLLEISGKAPTMKMGPGTQTFGQHDAELWPNGTMTVFDDGEPPANAHKYSRGVLESVNPQTNEVTLIRQFAHSPSLLADFEGSVQPLPDGDYFVGWGQQPYFSEYNSAGRQDFDARFLAPTSSYRAYRFAWNGQPLSRPALAVSANADGASDLYASWNGATDVASWRVLGGSSPSSLQVLGSAPWRNFETHVAVHSAESYYEIQALDSQGNALSSSSAQGAPQHIAVYGRSSFVPLQGGLAGLPVACAQSSTCRLVTSVHAGRRLLARSGAERMAAHGAGLVYFRLSPAGLASLRRARGNQLRVSVTVQDSSGRRAQVPLNLVGYRTGGRGPARSVQNVAELQFVGATDFISRAGVGGILAACHSAAPCHVKLTLTAGGQTIASSGTEFLGAGELGYVYFKLTGAGLAMLRRASGNQLGTQVVLSDGSATAHAQVALVRF